MAPGLKDLAIQWENRHYTKMFPCINVLSSKSDIWQHTLGNKEGAGNL